MSELTCGSLIGEEGQIVIPKEIRDRLGLKVGKQLFFELESDHIILISERGKDFATEFFSIVKKKLKEEINFKDQYEEENDARNLVLGKDLKDSRHDALQSL